MSDAYKTLLDILAAWNQTRSDLARQATERQDNWRFTTVQLRRKLQEHIAAIAAATIGLDVGAHAAGELETFRRALATLRTQLAMHQAQWPAVSIQPDDKEYKASTAVLRQANDAFDIAARQLVGKLPTLPRAGSSTDVT